jgi:ornithine cyclodeaminase/alanine dehydrogenase-like protein (mu-crystallin family)
MSHGSIGAADIDSTQLRLIGADEVDALASVPLALRAAQQAAQATFGGKVATGRVQVNGPVAWLRVLAGMVTELDLLGYKEFHRTGNDVYYHVHLFQESTGRALGIVDGRRITSLRTSATAAAAVAHWAAGRPIRLGLVGSGEEAREGARAISGSCSVRSAAVFSPTPANRASFATRMSAELALDVVARDTLAAVAESCDVLYVATSSFHTPFLSASQLGEAKLIAAIGATQPVHRELEADVFLRAADVVLDTPDAAWESGDGKAATEAGWDASGAILLGQYLQHERPAAADGTRHTLFKSIGSVEQDLVLALHLLHEAQSRGMGRRTTDPASLRVMR